MKLWTLWVQGDDSTWLEAAWEDEQTIENPTGWKAEVERVILLAYENNYQWRTAVIEINGGLIYDAFDNIVIDATHKTCAKPQAVDHARPMSKDPPLT